MENFKLQSWKIKLEKWHEPSNKSTITGFYKGKNSKFTGSFFWGCFMRHRLKFLWCCFWSPLLYLYQLLKQMIPQHQGSVLSPLLHPPLILGNSLPNSCVTDGCWFSSISHFCHVHQIYKRLHNLLWGILTIRHSRVMHW